MSHIKLEYSIPYCTNGRNERLFLDYYFSCDGPSSCDMGAYTRPLTAEKRLANPQCAFLKYRRGIIEGDYKRFKYEEGGGLVIGNKTYYAEDIDELEIDGKKYIERGIQC